MKPTKNAPAQAPPSAEVIGKSAVALGRPAEAIAPLERAVALLQTSRAENLAGAIGLATALRLAYAGSPLVQY